MAHEQPSYPSPTGHQMGEGTHPFYSNQQPISSAEEMSLQTRLSREMLEGLVLLLFYSWLEMACQHVRPSSWATDGQISLPTSCFGFLFLTCGATAVTSDDDSSTSSSSHSPIFGSLFGICRFRPEIKHDKRMDSLVIGALLSTTDRWGVAKR